LCAVILHFSYYAAQQNDSDFFVKQNKIQ